MIAMFPKFPSQSKEAELVQAVNRDIMFRWLKKHAMRLPAGANRQWSWYTTIALVLLCKCSSCGRLV